MNNLPLAFLMGLLGSLHCAVMCGPLMLSLPLQKAGHFKTALQLLLYQAGRILVYTLLGLIVGYVGSSIKVFTSQETLSLAMGIFLIVFTILQLSSCYVQKLGVLQQKLVVPISKWMGKLYGLRFWGFFAGLLNGFLPCGMVYLALATALNTGGIKDGGQFMFLFGIGTTPLMLLISLGGFYLKRYIPFNTQKMVPWFMLLMGFMLILRATDLGIPFLSPNNNMHAHGTVVECR